MQKNKYLYTFSYDSTESELCQLESRHVFNKEVKNRLLASDIKAAPWSSAFIKKRLDIICFSEDYVTLINAIEQEEIRVEGFKVEYLVLDDDETVYRERLTKLKDIGYRIEGFPDYLNPTRTYALCYYEGIWYFGNLIKNNTAWQKHNQKPHSYSNSIGINTAKALVNIASKANVGKRLLDACCGVGTIMLEACFTGSEIEGCDINHKICNDARDNLSHFNYNANVYCSDIKNISQRYDAAIVDLPYNLFSTATDNDIEHIIESVAKITDRLVIVSVADITDLISKSGFSITDSCSVRKRGKANFARRIWVCEANR